MKTIVMQNFLTKARCWPMNYKKGNTSGQKASIFLSKVYMTNLQIITHFTFCVRGETIDICRPYFFMFKGQNARKIV